MMTSKFHLSSKCMIYDVNPIPSLEPLVLALQYFPALLKEFPNSELISSGILSYTFLLAPISGWESWSCVADLSLN